LAKYHQGRTRRKN